VLVLAFLLPAGCTRTVAPATRGPLVHVRLLASQDQVLLTAQAPPTLRCSSDPAPRAVALPAGQPVQVLLGGDGTWRIGNMPAGSGELIVKPSADGSVLVNGKPYRGQYRLVPVAAGKFDLVNEVDVDSYLKGVLACELPSRWEEEAYKAQAIAARTYALYEARTSSAGHWDLLPDTRSQVYGGMESETSKSVQAVDETAGIVLAYGPAGQERIFKAYFSACCGGISQSAYDAFGEAYLQPLGAQDVGALCNASPKFNWGPIVLSKEELTRRAQIWGQRKGHPIKSISAVERIDPRYVNQFGRPVKYLWTDRNGGQYLLTSEETRQACNAGAAEGTPTLASGFFRTVIQAQSIQFVDGHGSGHGVGLCQWCSEVRAERGMRAEDIVLAAYPNARLVYAYEP
jgi:stage II sporulation protein D